MPEPDLQSPDLDDPDYARFAWGRYRKLMAWMVLVAVVAVLAAIGWLRTQHDEIPIHMLIATILGVSFSVLLGTALMGLVFLSAGSGHDERIQDHSGDKR